MATSLMSEIPKFPVKIIYDPANSVYDDDNDNSYVARSPQYIQVGVIPEGTVAEISVKLSPEQEFTPVKQLTSASSAEDRLYFCGGLNFVMVERVDGSGNFVAVAQF